MAVHLFEYADKYVHHVSEIPDGEHWVIVENSIRDDGYGGTEPIVTGYAVYKDKEKFLRALEYSFKDSYGQTRYVGLHVANVYRPVVSVGVKEK